MKHFSLLLFMLCTVIITGCSSSGIQNTSQTDYQSILKDDAFIKEQVRCLDFLSAFDVSVAEPYCTCITEEIIKTLDNEGIEYLRTTTNKTFMTELPGAIADVKTQAMSTCEGLSPIIEDEETHYRKSVYDKCVRQRGIKYSNKCTCIAEKVSKEITQYTSSEEMTSMFVKYNRTCPQ